MRSRGHEVGLLCARSWPEGGFKIETSQNTDEDVFPRFAIPNGWGPYYTLWPPISPVVRRFRPDLIHFREEVFTLASAQFQFERKFAFRDVPFIFETHQNILKRYPLPARMLQRSAFETSIGAIAGIPAAAEVLRKSGYSGAVETIPLGGIHPPIFPPRSGPSDVGSPPVVGYVGRLSSEKGLDLLMRAVKRLPMPARLLLVGDGPDRAYLETVARDLGLDVQLAGAVPQDRVAGYLHRMDALVLPSRKKGTGKEQWGRSMTEAMACGTPVIASDVGEIPYAAGDAAMIFPEESEDELVAALVRVLTDPKLRTQLIGAGLTRAATFTWDRLAEATEAFYFRVMQLG